MHLNVNSHVGLEAARLDKGVDNELPSPDCVHRELQAEQVHSEDPGDGDVGSEERQGRCLGVS